MRVVKREWNPLPNSISAGDKKFQAERISLGARMAITVDHDGSGTYSCLLVDAAGDSIVGTEFKAREMNADETVADGTIITVVPVRGFWGFLRRVEERVIRFDAINKINENPSAVDTVFEDVGTMTNGLAGGQVDWESRLILHAEKSFCVPGKKFRMGFVNSISNLTFSSTFGYGIWGVDVYGRLITEDFDPETVCWSNKPDAGADVLQGTGHIALTDYVTGGGYSYKLTGGFGISGALFGDDDPINETESFGLEISTPLPGIPELSGYSTWSLEYAMERVRCFILLW
jgi:hypothetical protein